MFALVTMLHNHTATATIECGRIEAMQDDSAMELRCYAYRRGDVWEAICTYLDVATFGPRELT